VFFVSGALVEVVDDRLVNVPSDEIDRRERRQRAARVGSDELIHVRDAVLLRELRDLVEQLESDPVAGERRRVGAFDHDAAERCLEHLAHQLDDVAVRLRVRNDLGAGDDGRRVEEMHAEEVLLEFVAAAVAHLRDRKT
jgi:hypothetical protein